MAGPRRHGAQPAARRRDQGRTRYARARTATVRRDLIAVPARTARHGRGNLILHLPAGHHREHAWLNLWTDATGPPAAVA